MLKHEDTSYTPPKSAAQVRVTPEELAAAVTALQIRKEGQPGTIAIGDAVEELGLDVTPEEVLAEVQGRRATKKRLLSKTRLKVLSAALAALVGLSIWGVSQQFVHHHNYSYDAHVVLSPSPSKTEVLSSVGNEQQVYVDEHGLQQLVVGEEPDRVQVYHDYKSLRWGLIKHGGESYVQGYTPYSLPVVLASQSISIHNCEDPSQPYPMLKVTLPVKGLYNPDFQSSDQTGSTEQTFVDVDRVRADSHLEDDFPNHFVR